MPNCFCTDEYQKFILMKHVSSSHLSSHFTVEGTKIRMHTGCMIADDFSTECHSDFSSEPPSMVIFSFGANNGVSEKIWSDSEVTSLWRMRSCRRLCRLGLGRQLCRMEAVLSEFILHSLSSGRDVVCSSRSRRCRQRRQRCRHRRP